VRGWELVAWEAGSWSRGRLGGFPGDFLGRERLPGLKYREFLLFGSVVVGSADVEALGGRRIPAPSLT
jgi:hypothetical protein